MGRARDNSLDDLQGLLVLDRDGDGLGFGALVLFETITTCDESEEEETENGLLRRV